MYKRVIRERLVHRLGQAEVDHLRDRFTVIKADQNVRRLQIAVDDPLLMRVLHSVADLHEEIETLFDGYPGLVAILGDGHALDVLHHEERTPLFRDSSIEHFRDVRMIHERQGLTLDFEPRQHLPAIHARLDQFDRHAPPNGLQSARQPTPVPIPPSPISSISL